MINNTNMTNVTVCNNCSCTDARMFRAVANGTECMLCQDCIDRLGLELCDECGVYHTPYIDMSRPDGITWVCDECLDTEWTQCACCGDYIRANGAPVDEHGNPVCNYCFNEYGYGKHI